MPGPIGMRIIAGASRGLLVRGCLVLIGWMSLVGAGVAADAPAAQKAVQQTAVDAKREHEALAQFQRLMKEARQFEASGKTAEAIAAWGKAIAAARPFVGDVSEPMAQLNERLGQLQEKAEAWQAARQAREKVLAIRGKLYGDKDWRVTDARLALQDLEIRSRLSAEQRRELLQAEQANSQVVTLYGTGNFREAIRLATEALDIRRRILGENRPSTATSLNNLAALYRAMGEYAKAEPLDRQALAIRKKVLGENHPDTATSLNNLAGLYQSMGEYAKAEPLYRQALEIKKKVLGETHPDYTTSLGNLAGWYLSQGDYARAEPLYRQALEINKKVLGETHPAYARSLNNLATLYRSQGDYARAEPLYRQALEIRKKALGETHSDYATSLHDLAGLHQFQGDYARAEPLFRQAMEIRKKALGDAHPAYAQSLNNLAVLYHSRGDYSRAEPLYRQALEITKKALGDTHPYYAGSLNNLAGLYESQGDYARAEPIFQQALKINKKALGERHPAYATSLYNLAGLYYSQGDYARAEPLALEGLEIYERHFGNTLSAQSERQQLALAKTARVSLDVYLSITPEVKARADVVYRHVLGWKGAVFMRQFASRAARTEPELKPLFEELEKVSVRLSNLAFSVPDPKRREVWQRQTAELSDRKEALERELSTKSAAFRQQQALLELTPDGLRNVLPHNAVLVDVLEYTQFSPAAGGKGKPRRERRLVAFVVRPDADVKRIDLGPAAPIAKAISAWRESYGQPGVSNPGADLRALVWEPLARLLTGAETILFSPDGALCQFPLGALPGSKRNTYLLEERNVLIVPVPRLLPPLLASAGSQSADGRTNAALLIGDVDFGSEPGIVSLAKNDVTEGREVHRSAARGTGRRETVFGSLPGTAQEVEAIRILYERQFGQKQTHVILGPKATEQIFRTEAPKHRWLHLATHGFFAPETVHSALDRNDDEKQRADGMLFAKAEEVRGFHPGLLSGIALARANLGARAETSAVPASDKDRDDGILTALEVEGLDLANLELVVLSACETGLGKTAGGEGVLGLQRAFQIAGARTCVASLWKVDDAATQVLMNEFYTNLWQKKLGKLEALRQAQLRMLHEYDPQQKKFVSRGLDIPADKATGHERGSPFYWAAFVLSGDWR